jgi:fluoride exporter
MIQVILVGLGGALGAVFRYLLSGWVLHHAVNLRFPLGTFAVNMLGCLIVGVLGGLAVKYDLFASNTRLFLFTGIVGGFTTYSAFGLETFYLIRRGEILIAGSYIVSSVIVGLLILWIGFSVIPSRN